MYRRSVITDEISQDLDVVLDVARAFRLDGLEIRSIWDTRIDQLEDLAVSRLRSSAVDANLTIAAVAPPFYKCDIDSPDERRLHLDILRRSIDIAHRLGTNLIRTFTFWKSGHLDHVFDRIVDYYQEPADIAKEAGAVLAVENEYACMVGTGRELARFVAAVDRPEVHALWDPCNAYFAVDAERPFPDGYEAVRERMVHVHLKDAARRNGLGEPQLTPLGEGDIDVAGQLRQLVADGYEGYVSLETHWRPDVLDAATMRLPGGSVFSNKAAAATVYCLRRWDELIGRERLEEEK
jgi:sugar phosphate isomerase/epimerase